MNNLINYLKETFANKVMALSLILIAFTIMCMTGDATALLFILMISVPLFFAKKNWVMM